MTTGTRTAARVRRARPWLALAMAYAITTGCSDAPAAPEAPVAPVAPVATSPSAPGNVRLEVVDPPVRAYGLQRRSRLARDISVTARIGRRGGMFAIPRAGLLVFVPPGAITGSDVVDFTATALAGDMVAYDFGPHGLHFARPLHVSQELHGINWHHTPRANFEAGYFASRSQIDAENNMVEINEFLPLDVDMTGSRMRFNVEHFSGYIITTGRTK